jgi:crossover junction endodeoxyribonuclease RusA
MTPCKVCGTETDGGLQCEKCRTGYAMVLPRVRTDSRLTLPLPPTMNSYWRAVGRRVLISAKGRAFRKACQCAAIAQRPVLLDGDVAVRGTVYLHRRGCDLDNRIKPLLDALQGIAYANDGQVAEIHLRRALDPRNPRVVVTIEPYREVA